MSWKCDYCDSYNEDTSTKCFVCGRAQPKKKAGASASSKKTEGTAKADEKTTTKAEKKDSVKADSKKRTTTGSASKGSTSTSSTSKGSTSASSTSKASTSKASTSKASTSKGSTSKDSTSLVNVLWMLLMIAIIIYLILYYQGADLFGRSEVFTRLMCMVMDPEYLNADTVLAEILLKTLV